MKRSLMYCKGIYQWWTKPYYVAPVVSPLERGADFSFCDGRQLPFTTKFQLERRQKQVELTSRTVRYLAEINEAERLFGDKRARDHAERVYERKSTPLAKGVEELS